MSVSTMKRLTVFAFRQDAKRILRKLMNLRCVEINTADITDEQLALRRVSCDETLSSVDRRLGEIETVIPVLTRYSRRKNGLGRIVHAYDPTVFRRDGSMERAEKTVEQTVALEAQIREIKAELGREEGRMAALEPWLLGDLSFGETETKNTVTWMGSCPVKLDRERMDREADELGAYVEIVSEDKSGVYLTVTFHRESEAAVSAMLAGYGFLRSESESETGTAHSLYDRGAARCEELEAQLVNAEEQARELSESLELVEILYDIVKTEQTAAQLQRRLAETNACTVLDGWIPTFTQDAVEEALAKFECAYEIDDPSPEDEPPVLLRNNKFAINFEWVVGMYSYPKYGRFDPTFVMSIFYFIIFGLMFADVGYGLILVLGCFGGVRLLNPKPGMRRMLYMFGYCGISAIVMGAIFGGWFGDLPTAVMQNLLHLPIDTSVGHFFGSGLWFNPLDDPMTFLIVVIAFGFIHIVAGMVLQFIILCRDGKVGEAICTIVPYWVFFAGVLLMLLVGQTVGLIVLATGAGLILLLNGYGIRNPIKRITKGLGGLYGLVNYVSDLLSYSRVLALALVAAVIAKVINMITMMGDNGVVGAIVMVVVLLLGHVVNLAINVLGAFVHTSRLQYLEFFGRFYEDGGRPFEPVTPSEQYSEETEI